MLYKQFSLCSALFCDFVILLLCVCDFLRRSNYGRRALFGY